MILYTCGQKTSHGNLGHPCGRAGDALDAGVHTCAVRSGGGGVCWGSNAFGRVWGGESLFVSLPGPVLGL